MSEISELYAEALTRLDQNALDELATSFPSRSQYWNLLWRSTQLAARTTGRGIECWQNWDSEEDARKYYEATQEKAEPSPFGETVFAALKLEWAVLDIGAGPGNLTVPIAQSVTEVTAVEPAQGMATVLKENIATAGLTNTTVINKRWDDVVIGKDIDSKFDLVLISYAFGMLDLADTIDKVLAVARDQVMFCWHAGPQNWDVDGAVLWPALHDKHVTPLPKADVIFNYLYTQGIIADVKIYRRAWRTRFDTIDDATAMYAKRYQLESDDQQGQQFLRNYLEKTLVEKDGKFHHPQEPLSMGLTFSVKDLD